jgi:hypothetical protein
VFQFYIGFFVVGTHNTVNKVFHVVALEAYYTSSIVRLEKELIGKKKIDLFSSVLPLLYLSILLI